MSRLESDAIRPPRRSARVLQGYTLLGRPVDVIETSRGCTFDCSFCSIIEMRGRNFHTFDFTRVLDDIRDARDHGARAIFLVDDNITLNVRRFEALCQAIVDAGLHRLDYMVQAMTSAIADARRHPGPAHEAGRLPLRVPGHREHPGRRPGLPEGAPPRTTAHENGRRAGNATLAAIEHLHRHGLYVVGGLIVGNPGDTREAIEANLDFARRYVDWPYIQHPTPYPRTPMTERPARGAASSSTSGWRSTTAPPPSCAASTWARRRSSSCAGRPSAG